MAKNVERRPHDRHGDEMIDEYSPPRGQGDVIRILDVTGQDEDGRPVPGCSFVVLDYGTYHAVPLDRHARKGRRRGQSPHWRPCAGSACLYCEGRLETKVGHLARWRPDDAQLQNLRTVDGAAGEWCSSCRGKGCIEHLEWLCAGCGSRMSYAAGRVVSDASRTCSSCQRCVLLDEVYECAQCAARGRPGVRATIFDVDLTIAIDGAGRLLCDHSIPRPIPLEFSGLVKSAAKAALTGAKE